MFQRTRRNELPKNKMVELRAFPLAHLSRRIINELEIQHELEQHLEMNTVLDIDRLSRVEKLRAMEELWDDLSRSQEEYPSPDWHGDVLRAREEAVNTGRDAFVPWEEAKAILRARTK